MPTSFFTTSKVFASAILLRVILLFYGLLQDAYSPLPYTDIDYFVFTDAARYVSQGYSPYERETYRYTPLLAWILIPTAWPGPFWFSCGKVLFAVSDIVAGWLIILVLRSKEGWIMQLERSLKFASLWLLNPMVATISTRGSSEGLLGVIVVALLWAVLSRRIVLSGVLLGLAVHFKIYPFIYGISIIWYLEPPSSPPFGKEPEIQAQSAPTSSISRKAIVFFLTRIDHRHNFSPYNTLLHLSSALPAQIGSMRFESLAFIPQLGLSALLIPLVLAKKDLAGTMLVQTFAFVAFNKVCTSQVCTNLLNILNYFVVFNMMRHCATFELNVRTRNPRNIHQYMFRSYSASCPLCYDKLEFCRLLFSCMSFVILFAWVGDECQDFEI